MPITVPGPVLCSVPWCVEHQAEGCLSVPFTVPGSDLSTWLSSGPDGTAVLVIDGPGGTREVPVPV